MPPEWQEEESSFCSVNVELPARVWEIPRELGEVPVEGRIRGEECRPEIDSMLLLFSR